MKKSALAVLTISLALPAYAHSTPYSNSTTGSVGVLITSPAGFPDQPDVEGRTAAASNVGIPANLTEQSAGTGEQNGANIISSPRVATGTATPADVGIGTTGPATGMTAHNGMPVKVAGKGSVVCSASTIGAIRYNPTGNYFEICSYP